ncbi:hypothetical protein NDU88_003056 [Pleurodeles waltl]|uniref:Uncharacterized protein n=1 Tax=Pleurodeles waltl TaxID=8319 RepID=A0AAV7SG32_PLEWA|nr:hypothetical protein NDU88_003056 [Pleurodeles waltl]
MQWQLLSPTHVSQGAVSDSGGDACNRAVTAVVTTRAPETSEECPGGTHREDEHPEVVNNPDIQVKGEETREETEPEESRRREPERREVAEPEEEEHAEPEDEAEDPKTRKNIDLTTETSTETDERCNRTRHVP